MQASSEGAESLANDLFLLSGRFVHCGGGVWAGSIDHMSHIVNYWYRTSTTPMHDAWRPEYLSGGLQEL